VEADDVIHRLESIAEELADLAFDRVLEATAATGSGSHADPAVAAEERRLTRARRYVEKAVAILREPLRSAGGLDGDTVS
jgi:hypothetical protein